MNLVNPYRFSPPISTSYSNPGGTGDRRSIITLTQSSTTAPSGATASNLPFLVDGTMDSVNYLSTGVANGQWIAFDFGSAKIITEAKWYQSTSAGQGDWKFQASSDGSTWLDVGSTFAFGGATTQTITAINGNTSAYRYYRIIKVSGATNSVPYSREIEFKISS
jgi:hypothetical protein